MQRDSLSALQAPVSPRSSNEAGVTFLPVANGTHFNGNLGGPATNLIQTRCRQTRKLLRVIAGGSDQLQVEWANIYTITVAQAGDASCEMPGPNAVTARMSIEYPAGKPRQVSGSTAYSAGTAYAVFDQVTSGGSAWVCIQAGTGQTPADGSLYWRRVNRYVVRWIGDTDGSGTIVFPAGSYKKSLPVQLSEKLIAGDCIAILGAYDSGASSGTYIPYAGANGAANHGNFVDWVVDSAGGLPALGSALPDTGVVAQTNGNTTAANAADNLTWMKIPYATAITGNGIRRCVGLFGDSIIQGYGGDIRDGEPCGIFPRALDGVSWWRIAQGGNTARAYAPGNAPWQMSVVARCSSVIVNLGINDIQASGTAAQVQAWLTRVWQELARTGTPVYAGQLTPASSSTDAWATTANQGRFTNGGTIPTTQFPTDADYATTVYGTVAQWASQDGAPITVADGGSVKIGQAGHPVDALLDWKGLLADAATSWKWLPGFTADGVHPVPAAAQAQAVYLAPQMDSVALGRQLQPAPQFPGWSPTAEAPLASMRRPAAAAQSAVTSGSVMGVVGTSSGRYFYGLRAYRGSGATAGNRAITFAMGADPAKLKVVSSFTTAAGANTGQDIGVGGGALWIPAGYLLVVQLQCLSANDWVGALIPSNVPNMNKTGGQIPLAGTSADTATIATGTVVNLLTKWTSAVFCPFLEAY